MYVRMAPKLLWAFDPEPLDLGYNVVLRPVAFPKEAGEELAGRLAGFDFVHVRPGTEDLCHGPQGAWIPVSNGLDHSWVIVSPDPVTLSPSILCRACGIHGFVQHGKWVPA